MAASVSRAQISCESHNVGYRFMAYQGNSATLVREGVVRAHRSDGKRWKLLLDLPTRNGIGAVGIFLVKKPASRKENRGSKSRIEIDRQTSNLNPRSSTLDRLAERITNGDGLFSGAFWAAVAAAVCGRPAAPWAEDLPVRSADAACLHPVDCVPAAGNWSPCRQWAPYCCLAFCC